MRQHLLNDCITMKQDLTYAAMEQGLTYAAMEQVLTYAAEQPFAVILPN